MNTDEALLVKLKELIDRKVGWGNSSAWVNQDFLALSKKIQQETGGSISHVTLKRIWGKVKYEGLPQVYTLNVLSQFAGYNSWRDFIVKHTEAVGPKNIAYESEGARRRPYWQPGKVLITIAAGSVVIITVFFLFMANNRNVTPGDYFFSSHTTNGPGIPNSVVFDYDASKSASDSIIIQQSWDKRLRTPVAKNLHQHTLIYYYPGFFQPKLIVGGRVVKEHDLLIQSGGWVAAVMRSPIPVYFAKNDVISGGRLSLPASKIRAQHIPLSPDPPSVSFCNVRDFGPVFSDDFQFETSVRNDFREGAAVCQLTNIYLLCEGRAIGIPLSAKGCESALNFFFTDFTISGKEKDLSGFGVDFSQFVRVKISSAKGRALVFINDKLVIALEHGITHSKIIGIDYVFQGTGSVDYVRLSNPKVTFNDEF